MKRKVDGRRSILRPLKGRFLRIADLDRCNFASCSVAHTRSTRGRAFNRDYSARPRARNKARGRSGLIYKQCTPQVLHRVSLNSERTKMRRAPCKKVNSCFEDASSRAGAKIDGWMWKSEDSREGPPVKKRERAREDLSVLVEIDRERVRENERE